VSKSDLFDFDATTAGNNTDVDGANIAENCAPSGINNAIRALAAIVKRAVGTQGSAIASAGTTSIAAAGTALYAHITGTTAITALGTVAAGTLRIIEFDGILTFTHNATSLILPGSTNITTAAGDVAFMLSLGSGNWKCLTYQTQSGSVVGGFSSLTATSTTADATAGPDIKAFRNSASPADNDLIGRLLFNGRDESANEDTYASVEAQIIDATGATEDGLLLLKTVIAGTLAARLSVGAGLYVGAPTGGDKGSGTLNLAGDLYYNGAQITTPVAQRVSSTNATYTTCGTIMPFDDTIPQNTEGDEVLTVAITPVSATSTLVIDVHLHIGSTSGQVVGAALFVDTTASAIAASAIGVTSSVGMDSLIIKHTVSAGSTSARTYKVRVGSADATDAKLNGDASARVFGGMTISSITVTEYLP
jgi:hypothetical protein